MQKSIKPEIQYVFGKPALILPSPMYSKCQKIADQNNITVEAFVNALLEVALDEIEKFGFMEVTQVG